MSLTLISDVEQTPYSGMLPGHVAGFYSYKETHIDLCSLSKFAQANLMIDRYLKYLVRLTQKEFVIESTINELYSHYQKEESRIICT